MKKTQLILSDKENWKFSLYTTPEDKWYCDFCYSPQSFIDLSMLIQLTDDEQKKAQSNREFLIELADNIRDNYKEYFSRSLDRSDFIFVDKNKLLDLFSASMGNSEYKLIEFAESNQLQNHETIIKDFEQVQSRVYDYIYKITEPNIQLSALEIEDASYRYLAKNYSWINEEGAKAINRWLVWMCWHEGILKQ